MDEFRQQFIDYVSESAGQPAAWGTRVPLNLPQYLAQRYSVFDIAVGRNWYLGIILDDDSDFRPATFEKHLRQIMSQTTNLDGYCLIAKTLPAYIRKRLVERKITFVVPGQQMFWPDLGLAVQARRAKNELIPVDVVSPAAQAVLVLALTGKITEAITPKALAEKLAYSTMTMSRALDEIESSKLATVERKGRERLLHPQPVKSLWDRALPLMRNPVRETVRIEEKWLSQNLCIIAGESALAKKSMLVPPRETIYALDRENWKKVSANAEQIPVEDTGTCQVQLWRYDPALFSTEGSVDPFSLYLSLKDEVDERVQSALDEMMEKVLWS